VAAEKAKPIMFMIAGPNGAGKSTLYETVIAPRIKAPFINADVIQKNEMKDPSMNASYDAAKIAEQRRKEHLTNKKSFVSESTFSHPSKLALIDEAKRAGFNVVLYHVNVRSPNLSVARVAVRVKQGGHDVPEDKIRARYERNQALIKTAVIKSDRAFIYDNSVMNKAPKLSIEFNAGKAVKISESVPAWARELYKEELRPYSQARQNAAASSYKDIKDIVDKTGGEGGKVLIPNAKTDYVGEIKGESALHILQATRDPKKYIAHFKSAMDKEVNVGDNVKLRYGQKNQATVTDHQKKIESINVNAPKNRDIER
jgi:predicted ABC-type ATPase